MGFYNNFNNFFSGKKVLVLGHTGFKGSWLTLWLTKLGAEVSGVSLSLPSKPCNFEILGLKKKINHNICDIRNFRDLRKVFQENHPEIVFHLAAQALVHHSYEDPKETFDTNVSGTVNVLECIRMTESVRCGIIITSDKCYQNNEWEWGYRENDRLGGDDPYSASKACAEIAFHAYVQSFFKKSGNNHALLASARAGNVIGGGDWAEKRIIPDCVKALSQGKEPFIRNPSSTRPWQHVLEPLSGYLWIAAELFSRPELHGESFNLGPDAKADHSVKDLIDAFISCWGEGSWKYEKTSDLKKEKTLLKLSCDKVLGRLNWHAALNFEETVRMVAEWYKAFYAGADMGDLAMKQIEAYTEFARKLGLTWVRRINSD